MDGETEGRSVSGVQDELRKPFCDATESGLELVVSMIAAKSAGASFTPEFSSVSDLTTSSFYLTSATISPTHLMYSFTHPKLYTKSSHSHPNVPVQASPREALRRRDMKRREKEVKCVEDSFLLRSVEGDDDVVVVVSAAVVEPYDLAVVVSCIISRS